jgi:hypothetical protein
MAAKKQPAKRRRGPAPKGEYADKAATISTRITADLRGWLERAAKNSGRTLSQEIENRLRQTFVEEERMIDRFGGERTARILQVVALVLNGMRNPENPEADWLDDPRAFDLGVDAIYWTLEPVRPRHPPDWLQLEDIKDADSPARTFDVTAAHNAGRELWRDIAGSDERALPLNARMTPKQRVASIIRNKIPEIVERSRILEPAPPTVATSSSDEVPELSGEEIEAYNKVRRENYWCIYCQEFYPKAHTECPKCKGLNLSGHKHGGDGRQMKLLSLGATFAHIELLPRHGDREEQ